MGRFFNPDNKVFRFFGKLADVTLLGLAWMILSLPCITIGAASTALYYAIVKCVRHERGMLFQEFFNSFRCNFKQSAAMVLLLAAYGFLAWAGIYAANQLSTGTILDKAYPAISAALTVPLALILPWLFPILSRFDSSVLRTLLYALYLSVRNIGVTVALLLLTTLAAVGLCCVPGAIPFIPGTCAFLSSFLIEKVFQKQLAPIGHGPAANAENAWYMEDAASLPAGQNVE